jgi:hypothetical protein
MMTGVKRGIGNGFHFTKLVGLRSYTRRNNLLTQNLILVPLLRNTVHGAGKGTNRSSPALESNE